MMDFTKAVEVGTLACVHADGLHWDDLSVKRQEEFSAVARTCVMAAAPYIIDQFVMGDQDEVVADIQ